MSFKDTDRGFTLIEVMLSLAITASIFVTLLYTLNNHLSLAGRQEVITVATNLARMKMLEMEMNPSSTKGYFEKPYSDYYYETEVKKTSIPTMIQVSVTVRSGKESIRLDELMQGNVR